MSKHRGLNQLAEIRKAANSVNSPASTQESEAPPVPALNGVASVRRGAPEKYDELNILGRLATIEQWYREGKFDDWVALQLGVSERTLYNWVERGNPANAERYSEVEQQFGQIMGKPSQVQIYDPKYTPFFEARNRGKEPADKRLEDTAYALAVGDYVQEEISIGWFEGDATEHRYNKRLPPNQQMLWRLMLNRMPQRYRDKVQIEHSGNGLAALLEMLGNPSMEDLAILKKLALTAKSAQSRPTTHPDDPSVDEDEEVPIEEGEDIE